MAHVLERGPNADAAIARLVDVEVNSAGTAAEAEGVQEGVRPCGVTAAWSSAMWSLE